MVERSGATVPVVTSQIDAIRTAVLEGAPGADARRRCRCPTPSGAPWCGPTSRRCSPGVPVRREGPAQVAARRRGPAPRAGARRGPRRGDGVVDQLQHGVDVDLRAAPDLRVPGPPRARERVGRPPRPAVPRGRQRRRGRRAPGRLGGAIWKPGDAVTVHCNHVDDQDPSAHDDSMLATNQRIWGYETNYGGLGELSIVKANQLMPKPAHLTWEEAAVNALTNSTSYRMLVSPNGAQMTQGQTVLIWGAGGGIGAYACQYVLNGGGTPVGGGVEPRARRDRCTTSASSTSSTARPRATSSGPTSTPRTRRSGAASASGSVSWSAPTPRSCSSTRAARRWARRCSCARAAAPSSRAPPPPGSCSSTTTATSG